MLADRASIARHWLRHTSGPGDVADDTIETYLRPLVRSEQHTRNMERFVNALRLPTPGQIEEQLKRVASTYAHCLGYGRTSTSI
jgi:hypothetical protein